MEDKRPVIGITMGDPAGIGPEIAVKALSNKEIYRISRPLIVGDALVMKRAAGIAERNIKINTIDSVNQSKYEYGNIDVLDLNIKGLNKLEHGKVAKLAGKAAFQSVVKVIELAMNKKVDATVTCPINKESMNKAGYKFPGHTEIYAKFTNTEDYTMLLVEGNLRVVHVSTHVPLREACDLVKTERILKIIMLADKACRSIGIKEPKIGVAGLNPHSGEHGLFGREELKEIMPAVKKAKKQGVYAEGPVPADTLFSKAAGGLYDIVVAMYHDQGHIPLKLTGFKWSSQKNKWNSIQGVNITLGLPIIRCSVDHGTAFDIAGKGIARDDSLIAAIRYAVRMASTKQDKVV